VIIAPRSGEFLFERRHDIPLPLEQVFDFFSDPHNLERITPPWLRFRVLGSTTESIQEGTELDYALRLHGVPIRWRSRISAWAPPYRFIDEQLRGPYKAWIHEHEFEDLGQETRMTDRVCYAVPGGSLVNRFFVRPDIERIFRYRAEQLLPALREAAAAPAA